MRCEPLKRDPEQAGVARKLSVDLLTRCVVVADDHRDGRARRALELELESACRPFELHATVRYGNDRGNRNRLLNKLLDERLRLPKRVEVDPLCAVGVQPESMPVSRTGFRGDLVSWFSTLVM